VKQAAPPEAPDSSTPSGEAEKLAQQVLAESEADSTPDSTPGRTLTAKFMMMMVMFPHRALRLTGMLMTTKGAEFTGQLVAQGIRATKSLNKDSLQVSYIALLRSSVTLTRAVLAALLPRYLVSFRRQLQKRIASMHNDGEGIPMSEDGWLSNYTLEVLRLNQSGSQSFRCVVDADGRAAYKLVRRVNPCEATEEFISDKVKDRGIIKRFTCRVVPNVVSHKHHATGLKWRKVGIKEPKTDTGKLLRSEGLARALAEKQRALTETQAAAKGLLAKKPADSKALEFTEEEWEAFDIPWVKPDDFILSEGIYYSPFRAGRKDGAGGKNGGKTDGKIDGKTDELPLEDGPLEPSFKARDHGLSMDPNRDYVVEEADRFIDRRCGWCPLIGPLVAKCLKGCLPRCAKARLPIELPHYWMPKEMRDEPQKVLHFTIKLEMAMRFDSTEELLEHLAGSAFSSAAVKSNDFQFELAAVGQGLWPTLGQLQVKNLSLIANMHVWWDVFDDRMAFAFVKGEHPDFEWDVELSLLGCGLPLPDLIEDKMLSSLTERILGMFDNANPITIVLSDADVTEEEKEEGKEVTV